MPALSPVSCRHHPSSLLLFVPGCPGQPGSFLAAVSAVGQELSWFSLLSPEKDGDTQSPAGEDQQVRQPPIPFHLLQELPGGWRRWEPQTPLVRWLLPCLHADCIHPAWQLGPLSIIAGPLCHTAARPRQGICWHTGPVVGAGPAQGSPLPAQPSLQLLSAPGQHHEEPGGGEPEGHDGDVPRVSTASTLYPPS